MSLSLSPLLSKRQTIGDARHSLALAKKAAVKGDLRLGVSRAITAIIQASVASCMSSKANSKSTRYYADNVIQDARELVMGIIVVRAQVRRMRKLG